jgi:putative oxidoreductase
MAMLLSDRKRYVPSATTVLRLIVGVTFLLGGLPRIQNPAGFIGFVTSLGFPIPGILAWFPIILEPLFGLLLILGLGTRWVSLYLMVEMFVTAFVVKAAHGTPFIQDAGKPGVGFELDLLLLGGALMLAVLGSGQASIERLVLKREL